MKSELKGLRKVEEVDVKCADCGKLLANVMQVETNEDRKERGEKTIKTQYKILCDKCGGSSFKTKVFDGPTVAGSVDDQTRLEEDNTQIEEDGTVYMTLKIGA